MLKRNNPAMMVLAATLLIVLLVGYFCSYRAALLIPELPRPDGSEFIFGPPEYKVDSPLVEAAFYPAHVADQLLWPDGWLYLPDADDLDL